MPSVSVLPTFVSKDTDLKADSTNKEISSNLTEHNKSTHFSCLVAQHQVDKNQEHHQLNNQDKTLAAQGDNTAAIDSRDSTASGKTELEQPTDDELNAEDVTLTTDNSVDKQALLTDKNKDVVEKNANALSDKVSLAESERFMSLLYQSDHALSAQGAKNNEGTLTAQAGQAVNDISGEDKQSNQKSINAGLHSSEDEQQKVTNEHKLSVFAQDERLSNNQISNNAVLTSPLSGQALKDYQLLLQSSQGVSNSSSITSEQLTNAQLKSKISDIAVGVSLASNGKITESADSGLAQQPVEPIGTGNLSKSELLTGLAKNQVAVTKEANDKALVANGDADIIKASESGKSETVKLEAVKPEAVKLEAVKPEVSIELDKTQPSKVNIDKVLAERNSSTIPQAQQIQPQQTQSQQIQIQQAVSLENSESQVSEANSEESIEAKLLAGDKPSEQQVKVTGKTIDNITMRSASESQAQAIQSTQAKQNNDAYFEHQSAEVLNHTIASDTAHIQKNNNQLQQEVISIFRKDFAEAVKEKVLVTINQRLQRFDITLDPPEFGNMQVRVNLQGEQAAVNFIVQNQQAKEALEQNMHKLRDMLSEQGVDVGGANVEQQDQQQNNDEQNLSTKQANHSAFTNESTNSEDNVVHTLSTSLFNSSATGVDYYA